MKGECMRLEENQFNLVKPVCFGLLAGIFITMIATSQTIGALQSEITKLINEDKISRGIINNYSNKIDAQEKEIQELMLNAPRWKKLGEFKLTYYGIDCVGCVGSTKTGATPSRNRTIAVDPSVIPLGSKLLIGGKIYVAEDTGSAITGNILDVFVGTEAEASALGIDYADVYILE